VVGEGGGGVGGGGGGGGVVVMVVVVAAAAAALVVVLHPYLCQVDPLYLWLRCWWECLKSGLCVETVAFPWPLTTCTTRPLLGLGLRDWGGW